MWCYALADHLSASNRLVYSELVFLARPAEKLWIHCYMDLEVQRTTTDALVNSCVRNGKVVNRNLDDSGTTALDLELVLMEISHLVDTVIEDFSIDAVDSNVYIVLAPDLELEHAFVEAFDTWIQFPGIQEEASYSKTSQQEEHDQQ